MNNLPRKHREYLQNLKKLQIQRKNKALFIPDKAIQTKSSSIPTQNVCANLKYVAHLIHSSTLRSSEKRPVQNSQSASFSSSSVETSAKGTVRLVSESDGMSDGVGSRQTLLFRILYSVDRAS
jgi:hypothetical protein